MNKLRNRVKVFLLRFHRPRQVLFWLSVVVANLAFFIGAFPYTLKKGYVDEALFFGGVLSLCLTVLFWVFTYAYTIKSISEKTMIYGGRNHTIHKLFLEGTYLWNWDPILKEGKLVSYRTEQDQFVMKLDPVTENPKVRHLLYRVVVQTIGTPEATAQLYQKFGHPASARAYIQSLLYEFNDKFSKELSEFYNPLDFEQQREFDGLVRRFFADKLEATGIIFATARFNDALNPI